MLPLSPQVFNILAAVVEERAGLHYGPADLLLLRDKVSPRAEQLGFDSLLDYYYFLRYDPAGPAELDLLVELLVVHETYFFREVDQLRVLVRQLLPNLLLQQRRVRVWCAAAATGEEPLSLAMLLESEGLLSRCAIVATDVSERALARARSGKFGGRSLRALSASDEERWLERKEDGVSLRKDLSASIEWARLNLLDEDRIAALGKFEVILLRNVLIYFSDATVVRVVAALERALIPGGYLLVGASESLLRYSTGFQCREHGGAFFYQRAGR